MKKLASWILLGFTLLIVCAVPVLAQTTHSVWSETPAAVRDGRTGASYTTFVSGNAAISWTQATPRAYAHAYAVVTPALNYDFMLVSVTASNADGFNGRWDIKRNGVLVCNDCLGRAYALSSPVGGGFKIYVGTPASYGERWLYSGSVTRRFDF